MADAELRFLYSLLTTNRQEQNAFYAKGIPKGIFKLREVEVGWVYHHREQFGEYPSRVAFERKFNEQLPKHRESLDSALQPLLDLSMFNQLRNLQVKTKKMLDAGKPLREVMAVFKDGSEKLHTYDAQFFDIDLGSSDLTLNRYLERKRAKKAKQLLQSPWPSMNKLVKFFGLGELVTIAARLGMGKSWAAIEWAHYFAKQGERVLFCSEEMPAEQVSDRATALRFGLPYDEFRAGELSPADIRKWNHGRIRAKTERFPFIVSADNSMAAGSLQHIVTKIVQHKPAVVIVDGAYLIEPEGVNSNAKYNEKIMYLTRRFKKIAKVYKVLVIVIIQMNRSAEQKDGTTKGSIASVYGSDTWAQDSDWLFDLSGKRGSNRRKIALLKGRESNIGEFLIRFQLDPHPNFSEVTGSAKHTADYGKISFKGVS